MNTTLLIMAAGMGSRFGGIKQIAPLGPNGEIILDYSIYDAVKAGFDKAVFVIRKDIEKDFREAIGKRIEKKINVEYAFQDLNDLPDGFTLPDGRTKPWGTAHAVRAARDVVNEPFGVINADDYYGQNSYKVLCDYLKAEAKTCMVGFELKNTLSESGTVSRGICDVVDGNLKSVVEHTAIPFENEFPMGTMASMNMWGFNPSIFAEIENQFDGFLKNLSNPQKDEFFLPGVVDKLIKEKDEKVAVLPTNDKWYGVTYKEDTPYVKAAFELFHKEGLYNGI